MSLVQKPAPNFVGKAVYGHEFRDISLATFKGKWLVMPQRSGMRGATVPNDDLAKAVDELGIAGRIFGTQDDRVHSSGNWREKSYENRPTQVNVVVSKSDYDRIVRNIDFGRETVLEFDIENKWVKGPVKQYNVIADIPGTDKPDEMVIVCGHLDSWNTPGSQGANDNGTGSSVALEAARILMASGAKPRRTIRFILWSGEEQGLLGSRAYVDKRKDTGEIEKIVALLNDDGGTNYQGGYQALPTQKAILEAAFAPTVAAFPDMPMKVDVVNTTPRGGSSDHAPFAWAGVPAYFTVETGRADYGYVWHTQHDKIDFSIPEYLTQASTNHAVVAYHLASIPETLARFPKVDRSADWTAPLPVGANMVYEDIDLHSAGKGSHDHEDDYLLELVDRIRRFGKAIISSF